MLYAVCTSMRNFTFNFFIFAGNMALSLYDFDLSVLKIIL